MDNLQYHFSYFLQVIILSVFWVYRLPRRKYFVWRLLGCLAGAAGLIVGISFAQEALPISNGFIFTVPYVMMSVLLGVVIGVSFDIPIERVLLLVLLPSTAQLCVSAFVVFLSHYWTSARFYVLDIIGTAIMSIVSFFLSRFYKDVYLNDPTISRITLISSYSIVVCIFALNGLGRRIEDDFARYVVVPGYRLLMSAFVFFLVFSMLSLSRARYQKSITEVLMKKEEERHAMTRELTELINIKYHDLKHMGQSGASREFLDKDKPLMDLYGLLVSCGNEALDTVLTEKNAVCHNNDIDFTMMVDGKLLDFMPPVDIYALFGNALDNAVECLLGLPMDDRHLRLTVKSVRDMVSVVCENTCRDKLKFDNGLPRTTKGDNGYHGFGTKSIAAVCKKYNAEFRMSCNGDTFALEILMPKMNSELEVN